MALEVGIVGLPLVGKSTIFNALTAAGAEVAAFSKASTKPNIGVARVPDPRLEEIAKSGATHVALVVAWYQRDAVDTQLVEHPRYTAPSESLVAAIRAAHAVGLKVLLFPIVRLSTPRAGGCSSRCAPARSRSRTRSAGG